MTVQAAWWTVTLSPPETGTVAPRPAAMQTQRRRARACLTPHLSTFFSLALAVNFIPATYLPTVLKAVSFLWGWNICYPFLGLLLLKAGQGGIQKELWGPGAADEGEVCPAPASGAQPGLDPKQEAGASTSQPWRRWLQPCRFQKRILCLSRCFPASPRWFGELLLKSSSRSPCLCVF